MMGLPVVNPLADITKVDSYPAPDPHDPRICAPIRETSLDFDRDERFLMGAHRDTLFEQAYMLVGMENLFVAFHEEPNAVRTLFHRITDFHLGLAAQQSLLPPGIIGFAFGASGAQSEPRAHPGTVRRTRS